MKTKSGKRKVESGTPPLTAPSSQQKAHRPAFTLTEMLIVISIIGMLAAMSLGALYSARESARVAKTQATITKLDRIVQARYEEFASRRLPISAKRVAPKTMAELRFMVLCQLQQWEMPDKAEDVANPMTSGSPFTPSDINLTEPLTTTSGFSIAIERTALAKRIFRRCADRYNTTSSTGTAAENAATAEILYIWITCGDREAVEQFQPSEIGDTDEDGFPEFIDAWGEPIRFIRWPTCYYEVSDLMSGDPDLDHSEFDSRRANGSAFRLVPLIYSKGPDKKSGIEIDEGVTDYTTIYDEGRKVGLPDGTGDHLDNITNHTLGMN